MSLKTSPIPAKQQGKLNILLVLKGYSLIACGRGMKAQNQQKNLYIFYYGNPPNKVPYADLLCKGLSEYSSIFEDHKRWSTR